MHVNNGNWQMLLDIRRTKKEKKHFRKIIRTIVWEHVDLIHIKFTENSCLNKLWAQPVEGAIRRLPRTSWPVKLPLDCSAVSKSHPTDCTDTTQYVPFMVISAYVCRFCRQQDKILVWQAFWFPFLVWVIVTRFLVECRLTVRVESRRDNASAEMQSGNPPAIVWRRFSFYWFKISL